jgi:hypothetical protein
MRKHLPFVAASVLLLTAAAAHADPVLLFDTFGPAGTYGVGAKPILGPGYPLAEGDVTPGQWVASSFVVPSHGTFAFSSIELALSVFGRGADPGGAVQVDLTLVPDSAGLPGATALARMSAIASVPLAEGGSIVRTAPAVNPMLMPGLTYWLVASVAGQGQGAGWMVSTTDNRIFPGAIRRVDGEWTRGWPNGAFRVFADDLDAAPVPEPGSLLLVATGVAGVWRARRHAGTRQSRNTTTV